jgi:hypothetical protein
MKLYAGEGDVASLEAAAGEIAKVQKHLDRSRLSRTNSKADRRKHLHCARVRVRRSDAGRT